MEPEISQRQGPNRGPRIASHDQAGPTKRDVAERQGETRTRFGRRCNNDHQPPVLSLKATTIRPKVRYSETACPATLQLQHPKRETRGAYQMDGLTVEATAGLRCRAIQRNSIQVPACCHPGEVAAVTMACSRPADTAWSGSMLTPEQPQAAPQRFAQPRAKKCPRFPDRPTSPSTWPGGME